jgi:hypothetical protein
MGGSGLSVGVMVGGRVGVKVDVLVGKGIGVSVDGGNAVDVLSSG